MEMGAPVVFIAILKVSLGVFSPSLFVKWALRSCCWLGALLNRFFLNIYLNQHFSKGFYGCKRVLPEWENSTFYTLLELWGQTLFKFIYYSNLFFLKHIFVKTNLKKRKMFLFECGGVTFTALGGGVQPIQLRTLTIIKKQSLKLRI